MSPYVFLYPPTLFPPPFNGSNLDILLLLKKEKKNYFSNIYLYDKNVGYFLNILNFIEYLSYFK